MKHLKLYENFDQSRVDQILDKISASGIDSLTDAEKHYLETGEDLPVESEIVSVAKTIDDFEEDGVYRSANGDKVVIYGIDDTHVRFLLNDTTTDMQSIESFLNFMNGGQYNITDM